LTPWQDEGFREGFGAMGTAQYPTPRDHSLAPSRMSAAGPLSRKRQKSRDLQDVSTV
jgi:hypothetical protein